MLFVILFAVLAVLTLVAAFFSAKVWHWAHVLVVVALFFTIIGFSFLAAETLRVRTKWLKQAEAAQEKIEPMEKLIRAVSRGTSDASLVNRMIAEEMPIDERASSEPGYRAPGLANLRHELRLQNQWLGRVWRNAMPAGRPDPNTGTVSVGIEFPQPLGISEKALVYVFEQGPANPRQPQQGRQYLGEFRVTSVDGQQISLEPVLSMDPYEVNRLLGSQGPWIIYESMPPDRHKMFERFTDDQLRQLMPEASADEYVRDGTPWTVDDGEWTKEGRNQNGEIVGHEEWTNETTFVYRRRLRDYDFLFQDSSRERARLESARVALEEDTKKLNAALASAEKIKEGRTALQKKLEHDKQGVISDRQAIEAHLAALKRLVQRGEALRDRLLATNAQLSDQLAARQSAVAGFDVQQQALPSSGAVDIDAL